MRVHYGSWWFPICWGQLSKQIKFTYYNSLNWLNGPRNPLLNRLYTHYPLKWQSMVLQDLGTLISILENYYRHDLIKDFELLNPYCRVWNHYYSLYKDLESLNYFWILSFILLLESIKSLPWFLQVFWTMTFYCWIWKLLTIYN